MSGTQMVQRDERGLLRPGSVLNPRGRPKGSRNRLAEDFLSALQRDFAEHGRSALEACRREEPAAYIRTIASLLPKELHVRTSALDGMSHDQLLRLADTLQAAIEAAKQGLPVPAIVLDGSAEEAGDG